jgi:hypothetical protein
MIMPDAATKASRFEDLEQEVHFRDLGLTRHSDFAIRHWLEVRTSTLRRIIS